MSTDWQDDVIMFITRCEQVLHRKPTIVDEQTERLRIRLIREEVEELITAMQAENMECIADGLVDVMYVVIGAAVAYGIHLQPIWDEVQRANMMKLTGPKDLGGKQLKPDGWEPPDIRGELWRQGYEA